MFQISTSPWASKYDILTALGLLDYWATGDVEPWFLS